MIIQIAPNNLNLPYVIHDAVITTAVTGNATAATPTSAATTPAEINAVSVPTAAVVPATPAAPTSYMAPLMIDTVPKVLATVGSSIFFD